MSLHKLAMVQAGHQNNKDSIVLNANNKSVCEIKGVGEKTEESRYLPREEVHFSVRRNPEADGNNNLHYPSPHSYCIPSGHIYQDEIIAKQSKCE